MGMKRNRKAKELLETEGYEVILVDDKKAMTSEEAIQHLDNIEFFIKVLEYHTMILLKKFKKEELKS